jgi:hypothetical protein
MSRFPDDADGEALELLASQGIDMTQPIQIEFALAAPDEESAKTIEAALIQAGYEAVAEFDDGEQMEGEHACDESCEHDMAGEDEDAEDEDAGEEWEDSDEEDGEDEEFDEEVAEEFGPCWTVYVTIDMVPEYDAVVRVQTELDAKARELGGQIDGWGVMLGDDPEESEDSE